MSTSNITEENELLYKKTKAVPAPQPNIGIDTEDKFFKAIINDYGDSSYVDFSKIEAFTQLSEERNQTYRLLDAMAEDSTAAAALETYTEDVTEYNDQGQIVWVSADDKNVSSYVNYLLTVMRVDKNIYKWCYSLCKYGDLYLRLYRTSEIDADEELFNLNKKQYLNEDVKLSVYKDSDKFSHYIEMVPNPAEMFELTRFGKTACYIKTNVSAVQKNTNDIRYTTYLYKFNKQDVHIYQPVEFVHATLDDNSSRISEEVTLFENNKDLDSNSNGVTYQVHKGQSLLAKAFKQWRQLMLLENSIMLNRLTKSSIVRVINVQVGDMPKEQVGPHLQGIKTLFEQKAALNESAYMNEYTNPGPVENTVYVPVHGDVGAISAQEIGGDVDVKSLADLDYFKTKYYGSLRIPKQYLGDTDDATGFNGGTALSLVSSRYAKLVKRIQNALLQALTDAINILLLDKGLDSYLGKFTLRMTPPTTQEEVDRRNADASRIDTIGNIMNLCSDIEDSATRLTILKSLLSSVVSDPTVISEISNEIERLEATEEVEVGDEDGYQSFSGGGGSPMPGGARPRPEASSESDIINDEPSIPSAESDTEASAELPSIESTGIDMTEM